MAGTWTVGEYMPLAGLAKIMDGDSVVALVPHAGSTAATIARARAIVAERAALLAACRHAIRYHADTGALPEPLLAELVAAVAAAEGGKP